MSEKSSGCHVTTYMVYVVVMVTLRLIEARELRIAWMAPKEQHYNFSASGSVGALKLALDTIRDDPNLLPGHTLSVSWYNSECQSKPAIAHAVETRYNYQPDLFLGPPCSAAMRGVGQLASHWNVPVFGWVSSDIDLRDKSIYSTLIRLLGPLNAFETTMQYISKLFQWRRFAILKDQWTAYEGVALAIQTAAQEANYTITSSYKVSENMPGEKIREILREVKRVARILIFIVHWRAMRRLMLAAYDEGMTSGDYAFLCIHDDLYGGDTLNNELLSDSVWRWQDGRDEEARIAFENVIHVVTATVDWSKWYRFKEATGHVASEMDAKWDLPKTSRMDMYAPFLYDALLVWANLATQVLSEGGDPSNGTLLFQRARFYEGRGITGPISLDEVADREQNIWLLDLQDDGSFAVTTEIYHSSPDGMFVAEIIDKTKIRWASGKIGFENAPPDVPLCGFDGELCPVEEERYLSYMVPTIIIILLTFIFLICLVRMYRRRKHLRSMAWKIDFEDIEFVSSTMMFTKVFKSVIINIAFLTSFGTIRRLESVAVSDSARSSMKRRASSVSCSTLVSDVFQDELFVPTAFVRGNIVAVKNLRKRTIHLTGNIIRELNQLMELKHVNVCGFVGACMDPGQICLLWEYCIKGSLQDVIWNENIKLDTLFQFALCQDIAKGLEYIHKSEVNFHGNMKSSNCVIDSRWTCKLTDFGVPSLKAKERASMDTIDDISSQLLWSSPEILRGEENVDRQKCDMYSAGIIFKEVFCRNGPYTEYESMLPADILARIRSVKDELTFRPSLSLLTENGSICALLQDCWAEDPRTRPNATKVVKWLLRINPHRSVNMIDHMLEMLENYAANLESLVAERTQQLDIEKKKTEDLLYRMLPQPVAEDLKLGKPVQAEYFDHVTIYFSDIVGFTKICSESSPMQVVTLLNDLYTLFDDTISTYDVYKVETIGDAYMLVSGLPQRNGNKHIKQICDCALDILASTSTFRIPHKPQDHLRIRVGIHTGPVVAGVVGLVMPRYCLFGDTVNTASRMESTGLPMRIHLSPDTAASLQRYSGYHLTCRGEIAVKGKGIMKTFFLDGKDNFIPELPSSPNNTVDSTSLNEGPGANCGLLNESHVIATRTNSDHSKVVKLCANGDQPNKAPSACQCSADSFLCKSNLNLDFLPQETHL